MLELLQKVDYTGEQRTVTHFSSTDSSSILDIPEPETPETSMAKSHDQYSGSQRFGLRLAPPSQQSPTSNHFFSLQSPSQSVSTATLHANLVQYTRRKVDSILFFGVSAFHINSLGYNIWTVNQLFLLSNDIECRF